MKGELHILCLRARRLVSLAELKIGGDLVLGSNHICESVPQIPIFPRLIQQVALCAC